MNIQLEHISTPDEMRILAITLLQLADEREKLYEQLPRLGGNTVTITPAGGAAEEEVAKAETKKPKAAKPAATPAAAEPAPVEAAEPAAASASPSEETVTLEQVRAKLSTLPKAQAKDLVNRFGVAKLTDLPADKYAEVLALAAEV